MNTKENAFLGDFPTPTLSQVESALEERDGSDRRQIDCEDIIKERRQSDRRTSTTILMRLRKRNN